MSASLSGLNKTRNIPAVVVASGSTTALGNGRAVGAGALIPSVPMSVPTRRRKWIPSWHGDAPKNNIQPS